MTGDSQPQDSEAGASGAVTRFEVRPVERNIAPDALSTAAKQLHAALSNPSRHKVYLPFVVVCGLIMIMGVSAFLLDSFGSERPILVQVISSVPYMLHYPAYQSVTNAVPVLGTILSTIYWAGFGTAGFMGMVFVSEHISGKTAENYRLFYRLLSIPGAGVKQVINVDRTRSAGTKEALRTVHSGDVEIHSTAPSQSDIVDGAFGDQQTPTRSLEITFKEDHENDRLRADKERAAANRLAGDTDMGLVVDEVAQTLRGIDALCTYDVVVIPLDDQTDRIDDTIDSIRENVSDNQPSSSHEGHKQNPRSHPQLSTTEAKRLKQLRAATADVQFEVALRVNVIGDVPEAVNSKLERIIGQIRNLTNTGVTVHGDIEGPNADQPWEQQADEPPAVSRSYFGAEETYIADESEVWNYLLLPGTGKTRGIPRSDAPLNDLTPENAGQHMTDIDLSVDLEDDED